MSIYDDISAALGKQRKELAEAMGEMPSNDGRERTDTMEPLTVNVEFPRRQAMLRIVRDYGGVATSSKLAPVLVWPIPTIEGDFIVEHHDGSCTYENARDLTFLDSDELFDQYVWD